MVWAPHVTVAVVVERDGRFLLVEEHAEASRIVYNQPAGHVEKGESLEFAARREALILGKKLRIRIYFFDRRDVLHPKRKVFFLRLHQ